VVLGIVNVLDDCCHLLCFIESMDIYQLLILLQEFFDWVVNVPGEVGREP
jgi:hypothetical protein